jgi:hypothetical protein
MIPLLHPREIARWSARNIWSARLLLFTAQLLLALLAFAMGGWLVDLNIHLSPMLLWSTMILALLVFMFYPNKKSFFKNFAWRKTCDAVLAVCSFLMILQQSNQSQATGTAPFLQAFSGTSLASFPANYDKPTSSLKTGLKERAKGFYGKLLKWNQKKTLLEKKFNSLAKAGKSPTPAEKALYTVLGIIGAVLLFYLVALAACALSCNGAETAATMVAIVGIGGIIFLLVLLFKHLYKKRPETTT